MSAVKRAVKSRVNNAVTNAQSGGNAGYDPQKDYSRELQRTDLSASERAQLTQERQNKINAQYGGREPNLTGSNRTYTETYGGGSSGGSGSSGESGGKAGYTQTGTGVYGTPIINSTKKNETSNGVTSRVGPDMSRRTELAGKTAVSNGYTVFYDENGYATRASRGAADYQPTKDLYVQNGSYNGGNLWTDEEMVSASDLAAIQDIRNRLNSGQLSAAQANQMANQIRSGYGYTVDTAGNVYDSGVGAAVAARRQKLGLDTGAMTDAQRQYLKQLFPEQNTDDPNALLSALRALQQGNYDPGTQYTGSAGDGYESALSGYGSSGSSPSADGLSGFQDFLDSTGYDQYAEQTRAAIQAAVQNAVNGYRSQIDTTNQDSDELARQAYIAKLLGQKNLDQQLAANGYAGGMADSQRIAAETDYQNQLNGIEQQRQAAVKELESAITSAQLSGDLQTAQELADYLQQIQSQWVSYVQDQQQLAQQNEWRQQELDAQNRENAYNRAMTLLQAGYLPDDETLAAAGISAGEAGAVTRSAAAVKPALTWAQVKQELEDGNTSPAVLSGYEYYMGQSYPTAGSGSAAGAATTGAGGSGYNNGGLSTAEVKRLQQAINQYRRADGLSPIAEDGKWGAATRRAAGGFTADEYAKEYYAMNGWSGRSDR